jgi:hypothetical protein
VINYQDPDGRGSMEALPVTLRPQEVARWLGLHVNTVKHIPPAQLPYYRVGSRGDRRYLLDDVRAYREARTVR